MVSHTLSPVLRREGRGKGRSVFDPSTWSAPRSALLLCKRFRVPGEALHRVLVLAVIGAADVAGSIDEQEVLGMLDRAVAFGGDRGQVQALGRLQHRGLVAGQEMPAGFVRLE